MCFPILSTRAGPAEKRIKFPEIESRQPLQIWTRKLIALTVAQMFIYTDPNSFENLARSRRDRKNNKK